MISTATIFYIDRLKLAGDDNPFGVRFESQCLPTGSVVVGFMRLNDRTHSIDELVEEPPLHPNQEQAWREILGDARTVLRGEPLPVEHGV